MKPITLTKAQEERAQELHHKYLFIDCLCGNLVNPEPPERDGVPYLERVLQSGANVQSITLSSPQASFEGVLKDMYGYYNLFKYHPDKVMQTAVLAGIDSVEHGSYIDGECIDLMLERGTALCPTLAAHYFTCKFGVEAGIAPWKVEKGKRAAEAQRAGLEKAWKAGVPVVIGTDAGTPYNPHWGTFMEFVLFVEDMGFDPMDTLAAGTIQSARICGVEDWTGSITPGKHADFLVLGENPVQNIRTLGQVEQVYKDGALVSLPPIDQSSTL